MAIKPGVDSNKSYRSVLHKSLDIVIVVFSPSLFANLPRVLNCIHYSWVSMKMDNCSEISGLADSFEEYLWDVPDISV